MGEEEKRTNSLPLLPLVLSGRPLFCTLQLYIMHTMHEVHLVRGSQHNPGAIVPVCVCVCGIMECIMQLRCEAVITPIVKIAHDPSDSNFFILHLLFPPSSL